MAQNEVNPNSGNDNPKPLKKLVRVKKNASAPRPGSGSFMQQPYQAEPVPQKEYKGKYEAEPAVEYHGSHEAEPAKPYKGKHEAEPSKPYKGKYEAEPEKPYKGKHEAEPSKPYVGKHEAAPKLKLKRNNQQNENIIEPEDYDTEDDEIVEDEIISEGGFSFKDFAVKLLAVAASLAIIGALILNMPIFVDRKTKDNVSFIYLIKHWQPLAKEGELDKTQVEVKIDPEVVEDDFTDGLDLPQLVEGQYSVLLLGFDEDVFNADVMWVVQFDLAAFKINILQIPRDCCLPDYTSSPTGKINSVYQLGDSTVNPPIQRVVNAVQENFGIPIDAYVTTVCYDIVDMVDLIGGIPIHIDNEIMYEGDKIIPAGDIVLTGRQAEWFIRFRREWLTGDIGRMQNQRRFMAAAMQKLLSIVQDEGKIKLYGYLKEIYDNEYINTDMSLGDMSMLANFAGNLTMDSVQVNMVPGEDASYYAFDGEVYDVYSVHKQATIDLMNKYYRPYQKKMTEYDTAIAELVTDYKYVGLDDTSDTLDDLLNSAEPERDPSKSVK